MNILRAARANIRYHLDYIGWLTTKRNYLAGESLTYADFAAAAHLSILDYFGELPWKEVNPAKFWYARIKSRLAFRPLLADRVLGMSPSQDYANLDF